jgi:transposase-like protein
MNLQKSRVVRYSEAFKQQVIQELESGDLNIYQLTRKYGIKSFNTIQYWLRRRGKLDLLPKLIRVEKPNEKDKVRELEKQIRQLKEALADTQVRYLIAETQLEIVCKQQGLDPEEIKKKLPAKPTPKQ